MKLSNVTSNRRLSASALVLAAVVMIGITPAQAADTTWQSQKQAYASALLDYRAAMLERRVHINQIRATFLATAQAVLSLPVAERKVKMTEARAARDAAIASLGAAPIKPVKPVRTTTAAPAPAGSSS